MNLYDRTTFRISKLVTVSYSTSFSLATRLIEKEMREAVYSIYGFVRVADEIVDTFHDFDKAYLLNKFESDYYEAYSMGISTNPILHSFVTTVKRYYISDSYIQAFLRSMRLDLEKSEYNSSQEVSEYIYGSADVVGLMCLKVFCKGSEEDFNKLKEPAMRLGSAFQKVNFLRDLKVDRENLERNYIPQFSSNCYNEKNKRAVIEDIELDFSIAYGGIKKLPKEAKLAVLVAYYYYRCLLHKLRVTDISILKQERVRVSDIHKIYLLFKAMFVYKLRLV